MTTDAFNAVEDTINNNKLTKNIKHISNKSKTKESKPKEIKQN